MICKKYPRNVHDTFTQISRGNRVIVSCSDSLRLQKEELEDTIRVIRFRKSKKNRQLNGQKEKVQDKQRSAKHTHKTKDLFTRAPLITEGELKCCGRINSSCSNKRRIL